MPPHSATFGDADHYCPTRVNQADSLLEHLPRVHEMLEHIRRYQASKGASQGIESCRNVSMSDTTTRSS